ncbi:Arc family DNA-binding protein [Rhizobium ruizarguesonis]|uniref:Arc family DNA-binding protein n=1 Tax=Rhizobium ruizarguesonis TaxID=2081791 RepID=UPI001031ECEE|nr:Arc family DNA-binding protein [Rhizobium ruizarguesonis]TBB53800.1 Arc family DNA-binding protein [Rhizobium ruizarguesonis]
MAKYPSEEKDRFIVRMPDGMREELKMIAAKNGRSLNTEIVTRLAMSLEIDAVSDGPEAALQAMKVLRDDLADRFEQRFARIEKLMEEVNRRHAVTYYPPQNIKTDEDEQ